MAEELQLGNATVSDVAMEASNNLAVLTAKQTEAHTLHLFLFISSCLNSLPIDGANYRMYSEQDE